ncbi:hypothetical protein MKW94_023713 [Papaver nudicaule]|uniref:Proteinase inhibitor n=1 Tax=Papaver nudicaule TaxID=74823 RepID=A0AA41V918_PAPNU|nr:hypothetical protein [Papaver nudicaule]
MGYPPCKSIGCDITKASWPELVGKPGAQAKATIEREAPGVRAIIILKTDPYIQDFCCNRVWVFVNPDSRKTVAWAPKIG